ncbi:MAG TPA: YdcF family protein [Desulfobulbaceae bacterium]|nr:YdcF family protein [Desulfobulbaceae bacterium]
MVPGRNRLLPGAMSHQSILEESLRNVDNVHLYLSKLIPQFFLPLGASVLLALLAVLLLLFRRRGAALLLLLLHIVLLTACSAPVVSDYLVAKWERRYVPVTAGDSVAADVVIVLGGAVEGPVPPRVEENLGEGADRLLRASRLYKLGRVERIVVAGGNLPWLGVTVPEAEVMKSLLVEWGVPAGAVLVEGTSRNTRENAVNVHKLFAENKVGSALLVTSALHMPRAMAVFRKAGVPVIASPTDYLVVDRGQRVAMDYLPDAGALANTTALLREVVGMVYYQIKGWI